MQAVDTEMAQRLASFADIEEVDCVTPDHNGVPRGKVMTGEGFRSGRRLQMARGVLLQCIMGGYPPPRYYGGDDGDLLLVPDPQRIYRLPWSDRPRALALCDAREVSGVDSGLSTRALLKRVLANYQARGLRPVVSTELEFYIFAHNADPHAPFVPPNGLHGRPEAGYSAFSVDSGNGLRPFFEDVYRCMSALDLPRDSFMHEMGVTQFEINLLHGDPLQVADQTLLFKHLLREVGYRHNLSVVCMAKPLGYISGSSLHVHQSLVDVHRGDNVFSDANGQPTALFEHFIGGCQAAMAELTLLVAPHVNSYQRFYNHYASPNNVAWSHDNRTAGLRIPASGPEDRRVENRLPGADANPYLAIATGLAAGLQGIEQRIAPSPVLQGEFNAPDHLLLPTSMQEALQRFERSTLARQFFGEEFVNGYAASKREEFRSYLGEISAWERRMLGNQV